MARGPYYPMNTFYYWNKGGLWNLAGYTNADDDSESGWNGQWGWAKQSVHGLGTHTPYIDLGGGENRRLYTTSSESLLPVGNVDAAGNMAGAASAHGQPAQAAAPQPRGPRSPQPAAPRDRRPAQPAAPRDRRPAHPAQTQAKGWSVSGSPPHAYKGNEDLGLMVNPHQVVQPTNGGRLWALGNLQPDGSVKWLGSYGSVPGAPPPPRAAANNVAQQFYPPPAQTPPPAPAYYQQPAPAYYQPQPYYAAPMPVPAPYQDPYAPTYAPQVYAPAYSQPQPQPSYGVDPITGAPLTAEQAAWYTQYGVQSAAGQITQAQQQAADALNQSIAMGGGVGMDVSTFGGMPGGIDAEMLALLSGGDPNLALQMALQNGGYDPTAGGMLEPYAY